MYSEDKPSIIYSHNTTVLTGSNWEVIKSHLFLGSQKFHCKSILDQHLSTYEEMYVYLTPIKGFPKSRPITSKC